jgi:putative ABC transport system permease protein
MMLTVSLFMVIIVMVIAVSERRKEIGTLKAMGASGKFVIGLILSEAVVLTAMGGLMGLLDVFIFTLIRSESTLIDADLAIQSLVFTIIIGALAALWPARSALMVEPVESLRYE